MMSERNAGVIAADQSCLPVAGIVSGSSGDEDSPLYCVSVKKRIDYGPMWITLIARQDVGMSNDGNTILLGGVRLSLGKGNSGNTEDSTR